MIYQAPSAHARNPQPQPSNTKGIPDGHVGLDSLHVCPTFFGGSKLTNLPVTPPPNRLYSFPGSATLCAGARVHCGIRFSSVSSENRSSAAAMKCASTVTVVVLCAFSAFFTAGPEPVFFSVAAAALEAAVAGVADPEAEPEGAGVPCREGFAETVKIGRAHV